MHALRKIPLERKGACFLSELAGLIHVVVLLTLEVFVLTGDQNNHQLRARRAARLPRQHELPLCRLRALRLRHPSRLEAQTVADRSQHQPIPTLILAPRSGRQIAVDNRGLQPGPIPRPAIKNSDESSTRNS